MPELRQDLVTGRWVIISTTRGDRPNDFRVDYPVSRVGDVCPFCEGHEAMTPPEVFADRPHGGRSDTPGWHVRVVPNKYPALSLDGSPDLGRDGLFTCMPGVGVHEVIIETPHHARTLATMGEEEIVAVLAAYRSRMEGLASDSRLQQALIFKNHGAAAGATLEHEHSQLIGLPFVPDAVQAEVDGARRYQAATSRCVFCDIIAQELRDGRRVVHEGPEMVALSPYAARVPFETWILPRRHQARFEQSSPAVVEELAQMLRQVLGRIRTAVDAPPYNLVVHTAPCREDVGEVYHWHVEVLPKLTRAAGFEAGTACYINPMSPEDAARALRETQG